MRRAAALVSLATLAACSGAPAHTDPADAGASLDSGAGSFIALDRDFAGYRGWQAFHLEGGGQYPRIVYVNQLPPPGSARFPMGTMIVKEILKPDDAGGIEADAMVKRGGGFNDGDAGAHGWEFFGISLDAGAPAIAWRGTGSGAAAGAYGGSGVSCVGCHAAAIDNDYVQSPPLQLLSADAGG